MWERVGNDERAVIVLSPFIAPPWLNGEGKDVRMEERMVKIATVDWGWRGDVCAQYVNGEVDRNSGMNQ